ncbi:protein of unknown function [Hyphomicrobium sp. MC1]|nr:protein of unknown function [Hyphomicrobium sp. MC1]
MPHRQSVSAHHRPPQIGTVRPRATPDRLPHIALTRLAIVTGSSGIGGTRTVKGGSGGTGVPVGTIADRRPLRVAIGNTTDRSTAE